MFLYSNDGQVKIIDFGNSRIKGSANWNSFSCRSQQRSVGSAHDSNSLWDIALQLCLNKDIQDNLKTSQIAERPLTAKDWTKLASSVVMSSLDLLRYGSQMLPEFVRQAIYDEFSEDISAMKIFQFIGQFIYKYAYQSINLLHLFWLKQV